MALGREFPDLIDAGLTNFFFFRDLRDQYGPAAARVRFFDFFAFKYQVNVDGTVAAYRLPFLLGGDSLVFKQESKYYEHFYGDLRPYVHYVPVAEDLSDLVDKIRWAQENDAEARRIARAGQAYAWEHLLPHHVLCYHVRLFQEYARRQRGAPRVHDGMEAVPQPTAAGGEHVPCRRAPAAAERDEL